MTIFEIALTVFKLTVLAVNFMLIVKYDEWKQEEKQRIKDELYNEN